MAGKSFTIFNNDRLLPPSALLNSTERVSGQQHFNRAFAASGKAEVRENITIIAGENIDLPGTYLKATLDMVLNAGKSVLLGLRTVNPNYSHYFSSSRTPELRASVNGMRSLQISAGQDVAAPGLIFIRTVMSPPMPAAISGWVRRDIRILMLPTIITGTIAT
ncbi:Uncharacterised protein [Serratia quinivorans]|uniref:Uncharacterized protein n=1 Tax=Serratia quinivorans TaxID=137545 RepID=A0A380AAF5_9GAMM|nr:Uncharacterised protein [Serratia quinivorans]